MSKLNVDYYVDEKKRTVVCKVSGVQDTVVNEISRRGMNVDVAIYSLAYIPDFQTGKAVCAVGDEWDVEKGKKIAYHKAIMKLQNIKLKAIKRLMRAFKEDMDFVNRVLKEVNGKYEKSAERAKNEHEDFLALNCQSVK